MNTKKILFGLLFTATVLPFFTSCEENDPTPTVPEISTGLMVLNQGGFMKNNASLTYFDLATNTASNDVFGAKNSRGLGDTGQDIIKYGSKIYIAMYNSSTIEIINANTSASIKQIAMKNESNQPSSPRALAAYYGKIYITLYDGHVAQLDTTSLTITKTIAVGANPEGIAVANNKLYVANSGGMAAKHDSTISVIDPVLFKEERKIKVAINPIVIKADKYGDLYVISNGNYYDIPAAFQRIEAGTEKVTTIATKAVNFTIDEDNLYLYSYEYDDTWTMVNKKYSLYNVKTEQITNTNLIASDALAKVPYSIDVNPINKDIFIGETDYLNTGKMYCFGADGKLKYSFAVGVNPAKTVFITNK